jgi:hypothetical protein
MSGFTINIPVELTSEHLDYIADRVAEKLGRADADRPRTAKEAAAEMRVCAKTVRRKVESGELLSLPGSPLRISPASIQRWLSEKTNRGGDAR